MKLTKLQTAALVGVPILVGAYLIYRQLRKPKDLGAIGNYVPPPTPEPVVNPTPAPATSNCNYPLKKGVYNCDKVKQLQWALNHIPYTKYDSTTNLVKYRPLVEDGDFGAKTEAVLSDFWSTGWISVVGQVSNQEEMDVILSNVISDPAEFQAAENPYVVAPPAPQPPTTSPFPIFPNL
jgi:hypothetical protein